MSKMTNQEVRDKVDYEGLGYFVTCYASVDSIKDKKLAKLFGAAKKALNDFEQELQNTTEGE